MTDQFTDHLTDRRRLLQTLAAAPLAGLAIGAATRAQAQAAGLIATSVCSLYTEVTEGPFYLDENLVRRDMTEGRAGLSLGTRLQVVTADCSPVEGARVDLWHCDAQGIYSGVSGDTGTFLRGTQFTDARGLAVFRTIYPGWYRGRTTHIHFKVFLDRATILTGQIFFDDAFSTGVYDQVAAYARPGERDTLNRNDGIARQSGDGAYASLTRQGQGYDAAIVVGINPDARPSQRGGPPPGGRRGPPPPGLPPGPPPG